VPVVDCRYRMRMASKRSTKRATGRTDAADVEAFLASLEHPFKREILALRQLILGVDQRITEGIKWNAPSFRTSEWFATFQLRAKDGVQIILHLGAKKRAEVERLQIADPASVLEWLGPDRASVKFRDLAHVDRTRSAFIEVIRQWVEGME
jgi:hypothetical protein